MLSEEGAMLVNADERGPSLHNRQHFHLLHCFSAPVCLFVFNVVLQHE